MGSREGSKTNTSSRAMFGEFDTFERLVRVAHLYTWPVHNAVGERVVLDRTADVWHGHFPGLGSVHVHPDGRIEVEPHRNRDSDAATPDEEEKCTALLYGWGEPLSLARRGFVLAHGIAAVAPHAESGLLVSGDSHDTAIVVLGLASRGWKVIADGVVPLSFDTDAVRIHPRQAPILVSKRRLATTGFTGSPVRSETNVVSAEVPRDDRPLPLAAVVSVRIRRPDDQVLSAVTGHHRFDAARKVIVGGVLVQPATTPRESMAQTLQMAASPSVNLRLDVESYESNLAELITWWGSL